MSRSLRRGLKKRASTAQARSLAQSELSGVASSAAQSESATSSTGLA
jgi:hypothetical protein